GGPLAGAALRGVPGRRARPLVDLERQRDLRARPLCLWGSPRRAQGRSPRGLRDPRLASVGDGTASGPAATRTGERPPAPGAWAVLALEPDGLTGRHCGEIR